MLQPLWKSMARIESSKKSSVTKTPSGKPSRNPALYNSLLTVFKETVFSRCSLSLAVIFGAVFLRSFLTLRIRFRRSLSDSFHFLPDFWNNEGFFFFSFSNVVISFETVLLSTPNNSVVFFIPTIWPLLKPGRSIIKMISFDLVWFGLILWYINHVRLFNAKSICVHIYGSISNNSV